MPPVARLRFQCKSSLYSPPLRKLKYMVPGDTCPKEMQRLRMLEAPDNEVIKEDQGEEAGSQGGEADLLPDDWPEP